MKHWKIGRIFFYVADLWPVFGNTYVQQTGFCGCVGGFNTKF